MKVSLYCIKQNVKYVKRMINFLEINSQMVIDLCVNLTSARSETRFKIDLGIRLALSLRFACKFRFCMEFRVWVISELDVQQGSSVGQVKPPQKFSKPTSKLSLVLIIDKSLIKWQKVRMHDTLFDHQRFSQLERKITIWKYGGTEGRFR